MSPEVFLDSGVFIAYLNRKDRWHAQAVALFSGSAPRWCTSVLVFSESYSWFLHKMGEEAARTYGRFVRSLDGLRLFDSTQELHQATLSQLDRFRGSKLTYVDASSLALMERHEVGRVWSTDHHLALAGAEVLPRS